MYIYVAFSKAVFSIPSKKIERCILNKLVFFRVSFSEFFQGAQRDFLKVVVPLWQSSFVVE